MSNFHRVTTCRSSHSRLTYHEKTKSYFKFYLLLCVFAVRLRRCWNTRQVVLRVLFVVVRFICCCAFSPCAFAAAETHTRQVVLRVLFVVCFQRAPLPPSEYTHASSRTFAFYLLLCVFAVCLRRRQNTRQVVFLVLSVVRFRRALSPPPNHRSVRDLYSAIRCCCAFSLFAFVTATFYYIYIYRIITDHVLSVYWYYTCGGRML